MVKHVFHLFLGLFGVFVSGPSVGQMLVGPVVGGGISWVSFHNKESRHLYNQTPVPSFQIGGGVSFQVRKNFLMHTAILYSRKGENLTSNADPDLKQKEIYHFIDVPIVFAREFKIKFGGNRVVKWYAGMGPNIGYWLNGKGTLLNNELLENGYSTRSYKIDFNRTDSPDASKVNLPDANRFQLGLNIATGWVFEPVGLQKIYVNIRYEIGHTYISKDGLETFSGIYGYSGDMKARNMGLRMSVSYLIDLKPAERKKGKSSSNIGKKRK